MRAVCAQLASLAAGVTFGPAKEADIISVRVYDCDGNFDYSTLLKAYEWIFRDVVHGKKATASVSVSHTHPTHGSAHMVIMVKPHATVIRVTLWLRIRYTAIRLCAYSTASE